MSEIVNYNHTRDSLDMILERMYDNCVLSLDERNAIIEELDDALGNHADHLVLRADIEEAIESLERADAELPSEAYEPAGNEIIHALNVLQEVLEHG